MARHLVELPQELLDIVLSRITPSPNPAECATLRLVGKAWRNSMRSVVHRVCPKPIDGDVGNHDAVAKVKTLFPNAEVLDTRHLMPLILPYGVEAAQAALLQLATPLQAISAMWEHKLAVCGGIRSISSPEALFTLAAFPAWQRISSLTLVKDWRNVNPPAPQLGGEPLLELALPGADDLQACVQLVLISLGHQLSQLTFEQLEISSLSGVGALTSLTQLQQLEFRGGLLKEVPPVLAQLTTLTSVVFDNCHLRVRKHLKLRDLPRSLHQLTITHSHLAANIPPPDMSAHQCLRQLLLQHNKIGALPSTLGELRYLDTLDVSHNSLVSIPKSITALRALRHFRASHNKIKYLPRDMPRLFWLETLDVSYNSIIQLPLGMERLQYLRYLDVRGNPLRVPLQSDLQSFLTSGGIEKCLYDPHIAPPTPPVVMAVD